MLNGLTKLLKFKKKKSIVNYDDVVFLYQALMNREPENLNVINEKMKNKSLHETISEFIQSREYQEKLVNSLPNEIDYEISAFNFEELAQRLVHQWRTLGNEKPYWSVISDPKFMPSEMGKHSEEFWTSGINTVDVIFMKCDSLNLKINKEGIGLELGAGVGRLSFPLSKKIAKLVALDVSSGNLSLLQAQQASYNNIESILISSFEQFKTFSNIDFFVSLITLQHNPPPLQRFILQNVFDSMNSQAIGVFQIPIHTPHYSFETRAFSEGSASEMDMFSLPIDKIFEICSESNVSIIHIEQDDLAGQKHLSCTFYVQKR
jgi:2-polyprenyl-3-methyl-5-hydroxy-6-metoxy-1,4-benzoquinol methylase